jgi:ZIP family zinc transporter
VSLVLIPRGVKVWVASLWAILTSIPQPVLAPPAFLAVEVIRPLLPIGLCFTAGAMLWMVFCELLPDALEEGSSNTVAISVVFAAIAMTTLQAVI